MVVAATVDVAATVEVVDVDEDEVPAAVVVPGGGDAGVVDVTCVAVVVVVGVVVDVVGVVVDVVDVDVVVDVDEEELVLELVEQLQPGFVVGGGEQLQPIVVGGCTVGGAGAVGGVGDDPQPDPQSFPDASAPVDASSPSGSNSASVAPARIFFMSLLWRG